MSKKYEEEKLMKKYINHVIHKIDVRIFHFLSTLDYEFDSKEIAHFRNSHFMESKDVSKTIEEIEKLTECRKKMYNMLSSICNDGI